MFYPKVTKNDRWPIMNGPVINKIFLDCPFGGDKNLDSGRTNVTTKVQDIFLRRLFMIFYSNELRLKIYKLL